jgi:hypothetical protein
MTERPPTYRELLEQLHFFDFDPLLRSTEDYESPPDPEVRLALERAASFGMTHVFFRKPEGQPIRPVAWLVNQTQHAGSNPTELDTLHKEVWSAGDVPLVFVFRPTTVDIFHVLKGPTSEGRADPWESIEIAADVAKRLQHLSARRLANGRLWETYDEAGELTFDGAAFMALARELDLCRQRLVEEDKRDEPLVKRLLILLVLVQYLDERGVIPPEFFRQHSGGEATDFIGLLGAGRAATLSFFKELAEPTRLNGKVFLLTPGEVEAFTDARLQRFARLLDGRDEAGQLTLWRRYSFKKLPVELISHLYEQFLPRQAGVVYTPPFLVQVILDEVLPLGDETPADFKVLDPACGSGVFLVGAFKRLVQRWRLKHHRWPAVGELQALLQAHIFGVDVQEAAVELTRFSLSVALCDFLQPKVIWNELHFDGLEQNLWAEDFFARCEAWEAERPFHLVVGNPPFKSELSEAASKAETRLARESEPVRVAHHLAAGQTTTSQLAKATKLTQARVKVHLLAWATSGLAQQSGDTWTWMGEVIPPGRPNLPDKQIALLFLEEALRITLPRGQVALIQPSAPLLYNEQSRAFRRYLLERWQVEQILDLTALSRMLFRRAGTSRGEGQGASNPGDTPVVVAFARPQPPDDQPLLHVTVQRTRLAEQKLGFEVDHYDLHLVARRDALDDPYIWKANLMGGGRLPHLVRRLSRLRTLGQFLEDIKESGWKYGEGYNRGGLATIRRWLELREKLKETGLVGSELDEFKKLNRKGGYKRADWLTGKLEVEPSTFKTNGLGTLTLIKDLYFAFPREPALYEAPMLLIKKSIEERTGRVPAHLVQDAVRFDKRFLGIHAPPRQLHILKSIRDGIAGSVARFFLYTISSEALVGRSSSLLSNDLLALPLAPDPPAVFELEQVLVEDVLAWVPDALRQGPKAKVFQKPSEGDLEQFGEWFCRVLLTVYPQIRVGGWTQTAQEDAVFYTFWFGDQPDPPALKDLGGSDFRALLREQIGPALYTRRVVRTFIGRNVLVLIKPNQRRYWLRSIAIRDADELFAYLIEQGF